MRTCTWHRVVTVGLIINILQYSFVLSVHDELSTEMLSYSTENTTTDGIMPYSENANLQLTHEVVTSVKPQHPQDTQHVCKYPEDIQNIFRGIAHKNGPGWISLTLNGSKPCNLSNFEGLRIDSVRLEITGGRRRNPTGWELSVEEHGEWDSSLSTLTLNFTNGSKNCKSDWCWEPCTEYDLKIVPVTKNQQVVVGSENIHGNLTIRTSIENIEKDAKPYDLEVADRGSEWLLLRWKAPYCLPDNGKMYTLVGSNPIYSNWKTCLEVLNQITVRPTINTTEEYYHSFNMTKCNDIKLKPCTEYKLRVRGEYDPAKPKKDDYSKLKSNALLARTLPFPIENLEFNSTTSNKLRLSWSHSPLCVNYSLSQFSLSVKADSKTAPGYPTDITADCGQSSCTRDLQVLPCTSYEAELTPTNASHSKIIPPVLASYHTSFPGTGKDYNVTTLLVGSQWALLRLALHPQCLRHVQTLRLDLFETYTSKPLMSQSTTKECLTTDNNTGIATFNLTKSRCFPNFTGFESCTGSYKVQILPVLSQDPLQKQTPQSVQTTIKIPEVDGTAITNASILQRGVSWIYLTWIPPSCSNEFAGNLTYSLTLFENITTAKACSLSSTRDTKLNVTSAARCTDPHQDLRILPCTSYYFEVKAVFHNKGLDATSKWTRSKAIFTLPDPASSQVRNLSAVRAWSTSVILTWQPPSCFLYFGDYAVQLQDNNSRTTVFNGTIPKSCFDSKNQIYWPPTTNCGIKVSTGQKMDSLEPCTSYTLVVSPVPRDENSVTLESVSKKITFTTAFPDSGNNYGVKTGSVGFTWVSLILTLHPQCIQRIRSFGVTWYEEEDANRTMSVNVSKDCVLVHSTNKGVSITITQSNCIPNFTGFSSCTGRYGVQIVPELYENIFGIRIPQPVQTTFQLKTRDVTSVANATISDQGVSWISLTWTKPPCTKNLLRGVSYSLKLYEDVNVQNIPSIGNSYTKMNVSTNCTQRPCQPTKIKPCTEYYFEVKASFAIEALNGKAQWKRSNVVRTLPNRSENYVRNLNISSVKSTEAMLTWEPPQCSYFVTDYGLELRDNNNRGNIVSSAIIPVACLRNNQLHWPPTFECGIQHKTEHVPGALEPCTEYKLSVWPLGSIENGSNVDFVRSNTTFTTKPASTGKDYNVTTLLVGSQWALLRLALHPQCLRHVHTLRLDLFETYTSKPLMSQSTTKECLTTDNNTGIVTFNLTKSRCFPNFTGFESCTGSYKLQILPVLSQDPLQKQTPQSVQTAIKIPEVDGTAITNASILQRGVSWIYLTWIPPSCSYEFAGNLTYSLTLFENITTAKTCSLSSTRDTKLNVTSAAWCTDPHQDLRILPCTSYYFEVKAVFHNKGLDATSKWTRSKAIFTLPDPASSQVRNLSVVSAESTRVILTWQPPSCLQYFGDYAVQLQDNNSRTTVFNGAISKSCFDVKNQIYWPPMPNCSIKASPGQKMDALRPCTSYTHQHKTEHVLGALEPCTEYKLSVWPLGSIENGRNVDFVRSNATFTTKPAKLGKISFLKLTKSTETSLEIAWGNVTDNLRCLKHYEVNVTDKDGRMLQGPIVTTVNSLVFNNLSSCSAYQVSVKTVGKEEANASVEISEYSTKEPSYFGPPQNLNFSLHGTSINLTWDPPEINAKCVKHYGIALSELRYDDEQLIFTNVTTTDTHVQLTNLMPATTYQLHVSARTKAQELESTPAILNITTLPEPETASLLFTPFVFVFVVVGTALLVFFIFWCYFKRNCFGIFDAKQSNCPSNNRFHPAYKFAEPVEPVVVEETNQDRNSRRVSRYSMCNLALNRPIPVQDFDAALKELSENTCALLSEQFADLKVLCNENQPKTCGAKAENKIKNRYVNIIPYDHSRVFLNPDGDDEHGDYINASYVQGFNGAREYIAAQGPKPITVPDFWRMIWDQEVSVVVMVTQVEEQGKIKCAQYWPDSKQLLTYGDIKVTQILEINMDDYIIRDLEVERDGAKRAIKQMHYLTWPDFGCPQHPEVMLSFIEAVRDRVSSLSAGGPILVHCSAGVGRTGTFIAIDWLTQDARVLSQLDVFNTVLKLRADRMNMVQTEDQFHFIHICISHFLKTRVKREQSPIYANGSSAIVQN